MLLQLPATVRPTDENSLFVSTIDSYGRSGLVVEVFKSKKKKK